jgi:hypothetical protein
LAELLIRSRICAALRQIAARSGEGLRDLARFPFTIRTVEQTSSKKAPCEGRFSRTTALTVVSCFPKWWPLERLKRVEQFPPGFFLVVFAEILPPDAEKGASGRSVTSGERFEVS